MSGSNPDMNLETIDKALEWLVLLLTILVGVVFQFLTWVTKPDLLMNFIAKYMIALTMPLVVLIISILWQLMTFNEESKISLRLFSWSLVLMILDYDLMLLVGLAVTAITEEFIVTAIAVVSIGSIAVSLFPSRRIMTIYRRSTRENSYWQRSNFRRWAPFLLGTALSGVLFFLPFVIP